MPDNLRTAVTKHTKDELILQSTFADLEDFYDTIVLPPPARKPKGKPTFENHVRHLEIHLLEKLKEKIYVSFEDLNADIKKIVAVLNTRSFQSKDFVGCCLWPERLIFLFADDGMDPELLHDPMDPVFAVAGMVEMIDPACHPPVSKDMPEPFVILLYQFCQLYILGLLFWNRPVQPFVVSGVGNV